jgi:hypothetical protein
MIQVQFRPEIEAELLSAATRHGQTVQEYVENAIEKTLATDSALNTAAQPSYHDLPPDEWIAKFNEWMDNLPHRDGPPLSDWAVSRDSIYD